MTKNKFVLDRREIGKSNNKMLRPMDRQFLNYDIMPSKTRELYSRNSSSSTTSGIVIQVPSRTSYKSTEDGEIMINKGHQKSSGKAKQEKLMRWIKNLRI